MYDIFIVISILVTLIIGLLFFNQDLMWKWHIANMRSNGVKEESLERTKSWEQMNIFRGCVFTLLGLVGIVLLIVQWMFPK